MNLSDCCSALECEIFPDNNIRELFIKDYRSAKFELSKGRALEKVTNFYNIVKRRLKATDEFGFRLKSANSFPKKAGIASSASFFSALALVFSAAFGAELSEKELSILARLSGSGSACRSVPDGFVRWYKGRASEDSYAESVAEPDYWDIRDIVLIVTAEEKKTGSDMGHTGAETSGLYGGRLAEISSRTDRIMKAFEKKDFTVFGKIIEEEAISMHSVIMTQNPPLFYWSGKTVALLRKIVELRNMGTEAYFTIDAGENVHVICLGKDENNVASHFRAMPEVIDVIINKPAIGARLL